MRSIVSVNAWLRSWPESTPVSRIEIRSLGGGVGAGVGVGGAGVADGSGVGVGDGLGVGSAGVAKMREPAS
jgi:hypothetical protein